MIHNHLLINHLPVFGTLFGILILIAGFLLNQQILRITALGMLLIGSIAFYPSFETGEGAEKEIKKRATFDKTTHKIAHEHEEEAERAMPYAIALALLSGISIFLEFRKSKYAKIAAGIACALAIFVMFLLAKVANTGGQISHPELRKETAPSSNQNTKDDD